MVRQAPTTLRASPFEVVDQRIDARCGDVRARPKIVIGVERRGGITAIPKAHEKVVPHEGDSGGFYIRVEQGIMIGIEEVLEFARCGAVAPEHRI